jgi:exodeoxyribonuclease VII small subunit
MTDPRTDAAQQPSLDLGAETPSEAPEGDFEALFARLENVAKQLEEGNLSLEQSVALYEEGMQLAQRCQGLLRQVEQRIERLQALAEDGYE